MDAILLDASISLRGDQHMEKLELERLDWAAYALATGFVLVSSGAAVPRISTSVADVLQRIATVFI